MEQKIKRELWDLAGQLQKGRQEANKVAAAAKAAHEKATRKAAALKKEKDQKDQFAKYDADADGNLNRSEVMTFAKSEYDFEPAEDVLDKIMRSLEPVNYGKFPRLRSSVAIAKSEVKARQKR